MYLLFQVDTYSNILESIDLTQTKISYMKMDIESSEFPFFNDVFDHSIQLLNNIEQIGLDIHTGRYFSKCSYFRDHVLNSCFFHSNEICVKISNLFVHFSSFGRTWISVN